jgi:hypothetical protein
MREHGCFPATILAQPRRPCRPRHLYAVPRTSLRCVYTRRRNCIEQLPPFPKICARNRHDASPETLPQSKLTHYRACGGLDSFAGADRTSEPAAGTRTGDLPSRAQPSQTPKKPKANRPSGTSDDASRLWMRGVIEDHRHEKRISHSRSFGDRCRRHQPRSELDRLQQHLLPKSFCGIGCGAVCSVPGVRERHGSPGHQTGSCADGIADARRAASACDHSVGLAALRRLSGFLDSAKGYPAAWLRRAELVSSLRHHFIVRSRWHKTRLCVRLFDDLVTAMIQPSDQPVSHGVVPGRK